MVLAALSVLAMPSHAALAQGPAPKPGIEMRLLERGPCSVIECKPLTPRRRQLIMKEIAMLERVLRNLDLRPKDRELRKLHELYTELVNAQRLELEALETRAAAACSGAE